ncbi:MAG TPA: hypothetical protein VMV32_06335 [Ignavibacteriaceae bacterium]|nr:hypothetical protein [Ignavibacteriaceae bacterium]
MEVKDLAQTKSYRIKNVLGAGWVILDIMGGLVPVELIWLPEPGIDSTKIMKMLF